MTLDNLWLISIHNSSFLTQKTFNCFFSLFQYFAYFLQFQLFLLNLTIKFVIILECLCLFFDVLFPQGNFQIAVMLIRCDMFLIFLIGLDLDPANLTIFILGDGNIYLVLFCIVGGFVSFGDCVFELLTMRIYIVLISINLLIENEKRNLRLSN